MNLGFQGEQMWKKHQRLIYKVWQSIEDKDVRIDWNTLHKKKNITDFDDVQLNQAAVC